MKKVILTLAALCGFMGANAQVFYKVEKAGSDKVSYILGTHHFAPLSTVDSIKELKPALESVEAVYGELDMREATNPENQMKYAGVMMATTDSALNLLLTPAQLSALENLWNKYTVAQGMPVQAFFSLKPAMVSTMLAAEMSQAAIKEKMQSPDQGIDMTMQTRALELGKDVKGLEDMGFQFDMLYNVPISKQLEDLIETIEKPEESGEKAIKLTEVYMTHDINGLLKIMEEETEDAEYMEKMIYRRNDNWVKALGEIFPQKSVMVVVGAGHLPGPRGILEGFRKAGYTVTPIDK